MDDSSASGQTRAAHGLYKCIPKARQEHYDAKGAGHYGIFSGRRWREQVYPVVQAFIANNHVKQTAVVKAVAKPAAKAAVKPKAIAKPKATAVVKVKVASKTAAPNNVAVKKTAARKR